MRTRRAVLQLAVSCRGMAAVIALAEVLSWEGDMLPSRYARAGARVAYEVAADTGHDRSRPHTHAAAGIAAGVSRYQQAADTADPQRAPAAKLQLAQIRRLIGDEQGAAAV